MDALTGGHTHEPTKMHHKKINKPEITEIINSNCSEKTVFVKCKLAVTERRICTLHFPVCAQVDFSLYYFNPEKNKEGVRAKL